MKKNLETAAHLSKYVISLVEEDEREPTTLINRRIGLGVINFRDMLFSIRITTQLSSTESNGLHTMEGIDRDEVHLHIRNCWVVPVHYRITVLERRQVQCTNMSGNAKLTGRIIRYLSAYCAG